MKIFQHKILDKNLEFEIKISFIIYYLSLFTTDDQKSIDRNW